MMAGVLACLSVDDSAACQHWFANNAQTTQSTSGATKLQHNRCHQNGYKQGLREGGDGQQRGVCTFRCDLKTSTKGLPRGLTLRS